MRKSILFLLTLVLLVACTPKDIYTTEGKIEIINYVDKYITINQTIPTAEVMPAMVMSYDITDANIDQIKNLKEGDDISMTLKSDERKINFELIRITKK